jgi:hypothetical protein
MQHDILTTENRVHFEDELVPVGPEYPPLDEVDEVPPVIEDLPPVIEDVSPVSEDQHIVEKQVSSEDPMDSSPSPEPATACQSRDTDLSPPTRDYRRNMGDRTLTTLGVPEVKVKISGSAVDSITAFFECCERGYSGPEC